VWAAPFTPTLTFKVLDPVAGAGYSAIMFAFYFAATYFVHHVENSMKIAVAVNVVAWVAQFIGHGKYEGRAPALVDNLAQGRWGGGKQGGRRQRCSKN